MCEVADVVGDLLLSFGNWCLDDLDFLFGLVGGDWSSLGEGDWGLDLVVLLGVHLDWNFLLDGVGLLVEDGSWNLLRDLVLVLVVSSSGDIEGCVSGDLALNVVSLLDGLSVWDLDLDGVLLVVVDSLADLSWDLVGFLLEGGLSHLSWDLVLLGLPDGLGNLNGDFVSLSSWDLVLFLDDAGDWSGLLNFEFLVDVSGLLNLLGVWGSDSLSVGDLLSSEGWDLLLDLVWDLDFLFVFNFEGNLSWDLDLLVVLLLSGHGVLFVDEDLLVNGDWLSVVVGSWDVDVNWVFSDVLAGLSNLAKDADFLGMGVESLWPCLVWDFVAILVVGVSSVSDGSLLSVLLNVVFGRWLRDEGNITDGSVTGEVSIVVDGLLDSSWDLSGVGLGDWSELLDLLGVVLGSVLSSGPLDSLGSVLGLNLGLVVGDLVFSVLGDLLSLVVSLFDLVGLWDLSDLLDSVLLLLDFCSISVLGLVDSSVSGLVDGVEDLLWDLSGSGGVHGLFGDDWNLSVSGVVDGLSDGSWDLSGSGLVLSSEEVLGDVSVLGLGDSVVVDGWHGLSVGSWDELGGILVDGVIDNLWDLSVLGLSLSLVDGLWDLLGLGLSLVVSLLSGLVSGGWDLVLSDDSLLIVANDDVVVLDGLVVGWALPFSGEVDCLGGGSKDSGGEEFHS